MLIFSKFFDQFYYLPVVYNRFDVLFKDKRIGKIMLQIEKLEILKECTSVGIQITKKRSHEKL